MSDAIDVGALWRPHTHARTGLPKKRYPDMAEAVATVQRIIDADDETGRLKNSNPCAYPCSDVACGGWHVGNWSDEAFRERPQVDTQPGESFGLIAGSSPDAAPAVGLRRPPGGGGVSTAEKKEKRKLSETATDHDASRST